MDRAEQFAYAARIVGIVVFAAGIGGAVLGAYAPLQQSLGLCGGQTVQATPLTDGTESAAPGQAQFSFTDLSESEQDAFETALDTRTGETRVSEQLANEAALERGVIVTYHENAYRFAVISANRCVAVDPLVLPLGVAGVVLGGAIYGVPRLRRGFG